MTEAAKVLADRHCLLFCIGAQKAGTTWLYTQLCKSDAFHATLKEFHYWDTVRPPFIKWDSMGRDYVMLRFRRLIPMIWMLRSLSLQRYKKETMRQKMWLSDPLDSSSYVDLLTLGAGDRRLVLGDMTPSYALCSTSTFREMAALHHNSRFLFIMRDPIDRLISGVKHRLRNSQFSESRLHHARTYIRAALEDPYNPDQRRSRYEHTLRNLLDAVPRDRVLLLFFEDLFRKSTMDRICAFSDILPIKIDAETKVNVGLKYESPMTQALTARAQDVFSETYEFVDQLMGGRLPQKWQTARGGDISMVSACG